MFKSYDSYILADVSSKKHPTDIFDKKRFVEIMPQPDEFPTNKNDILFYDDIKGVWRYGDVSMEPTKNDAADIEKKDAADIVV